IKLKPIISRDGRLTFDVTVHHNDSISVYVRCSDTPIYANEDSLLKFTIELTRLEEKLLTVIREALREKGLISFATFDPNLPEHGTWICKRYEIGRDSIIPYEGARYCITYDSLRKGFIRVYAKQFENENRLRVEQLVTPGKPWNEVAVDLLRVKPGGEYPTS
ncbi:MAG: hypothetical protein ACREBU_22070, partial [Nitrososphaera sp.]